MAPTRMELIRTLWPDKALYGATLLIVTGLLGILFGLVVLLFPVGYSQRIPSIVQLIPPPLTIFFSATAAFLGRKALLNLDTRPAMLGAFAGVISFSMAGLGSLMSLVALGFLLLSRHEGEETNPRTRRLTASMWPDKSLAASLLCLVNGILTLTWGLLIMWGRAGVHLFNHPLFGAFVLLAALLNLAAARRLYIQNGYRIAVAAGAAAVFAAGFYLIGPVLGIATLFLIHRAIAEDEFRLARALRESAVQISP